jgi:hypothetical protein
MTPLPDDKTDLRTAGLRLALSGRSSRLTIQATPGSEVSFDPDEGLASDIAALIYDGPNLIGWGDDYGTVTHPDHELSPAVKDAAEAFVEAASNLWAVLLDNPSSTAGRIAC